MIQIFLFPAGAAAVTDLLPRTLRGGRCPPLHSSLDAGAPPRAPGDFLTKRKSPKIRQELPGSWTSGEGGGSKSVPLLLLPPLIPRLSALAVLVAEVKSLRHPQGSLAA